MNLVYFYILYPKDPEISLYTDVCLLVVYSSVHNSTCCGKYQISLYTDVCLLFVYSSVHNSTCCGKYQISLYTDVCLMVVYSSVHNSTCCGKYQISISGCYMIFECSQEFQFLDIRDRRYREDGAPLLSPKQSRSIEK